MSIVKTPPSWCNQCPSRNMKTLAKLVFIGLILPTALFGAFPLLYLKNICDDQLHAPTNICNAGDGSGRLFIADQPGKIYIIQAGMLLPTPFLDLGFSLATPINTGYSERGLLGLCFHPDYENAGQPGYRKFYVNYTAPASHPTLNPVSAGGPTNAITVIAEFQVSLTNPNVADPATKRIVLTYGQPQSNHNGGQLEFGPDGFLYIAVGDGGGANDNAAGHTQGSGASTVQVSGTLGNGQDRRQLLGKILRIDPLGTNGPGGTYGIPALNPFVGLTQTFVDTALNGPMRGEIYAFGMRNPWRFSFDSSFGGASRLICADVGQLDVEEIDFIVSGGNYGWRIKEGSVNFDTPTAYLPNPTGIGLPTVIGPIAEYAHPTATLSGTAAMPKLGTSITGGYVYRGSAIPALQGKYLCADYAFDGIGAGNGIFIGVESTAPGVYTAPARVTMGTALPSASRIYTFGVDESGEMYAATKTTSGVLQLDAGKPAGTIWKVVPATQVNLALPADRDNTMYEGSNNSNGAGPEIYAGQTGPNGGETRRRALLRFNLSTVPTGASLTGASVALTLTKQVGQDYVFNLHKVTADWGEGASNAGNPGGKGALPAINDATWTHRFYSTQFWASQGGDFLATASASRAMGARLSEPVQLWSGATLLADVQSWIATPSSNFGWLLRGNDDTEQSPYSAQGFASRTSTPASARPVLNVTYTAPPSTTRFESWLAANYPTLPVGGFVDLAGDSDGDSLPSLVEYAYNFSPTTKNSPDSGLTTAVTDDGINTTVSYTFRRDPRATDLTYEFQTSEDLVTWDTVVSSTGGAVSSGSAYTGESPISGESPMVLVSAEEVLPGLEARRFVKLKITRNP